MTHEVEKPKDLLAARKQLEADEEARTAELLKERADLDASTATRQAQITEELKVLNYKKPRAPRGSKKVAEAQA